MLPVPIHIDPISNLQFSRLPDKFPWLPVCRILVLRSMQKMFLEIWQLIKTLCTSASNKDKKSVILWMSGLDLRWRKLPVLYWTKNYSGHSIICPISDDLLLIVKSSHLHDTLVLIHGKKSGVISKYSAISVDQGYNYCVKNRFSKSLSCLNQ